MSKELKNIQTALAWAESLFIENELFFGHGTDNAWDEAVFLLGHVLSKTELTTDDLGYCLAAQEQKKFIELCQLRIEKRMPAAYLVKFAYFAGLKFYVDESVLVPRSPIAELILKSFEPWIFDLTQCHRVLDLCTGSGCIGIAIAYYFPWLAVDLVDISSEALEIAKKNIDAYGLGDRVSVIASDLFDKVSGTYDLIVTNPPYVNEKNWQTLAMEYHHEPFNGLVAPEAGLSIVRRIISEAKQYLTKEGLLIMEVGELADSVMGSFPDLALTWIEFEFGGEGVFVIDENSLKHEEVNE